MELIEKSLTPPHFIASFSLICGDRPQAFSEFIPANAQALVLPCRFMSIDTRPSLTGTSKSDAGHGKRKIGSP
jgi:hypothetical protein